jgi:hypothetical protein
MWRGAWQRGCWGQVRTPTAVQLAARFSERRCTKGRIKLADVQMDTHTLHAQCTVWFTVGGSHWKSYILFISCLPNNWNGYIVLVTLQTNWNGYIVLVTLQTNWNGYIVLITHHQKIVTVTSFSLLAPLKNGTVASFSLLSLQKMETVTLLLLQI